MKFRRTNKTKVIDEKKLGKIIEQELSAYVKHEELPKQLEKIKQDERRQKAWQSLSVKRKVRWLNILSDKQKDELFASLLPRQKIEMRYLLRKKGEQHGKA